MNGWRVVVVREGPGAKEAAKKLNFGEPFIIASLQDARGLLRRLPGFPPRYVRRPPRATFISSLRDEENAFLWREITRLSGA
jgi:hypothetical protein